MKAEKRMQGKRVLVSGSGTGIGQGVALEFAEQGATVALHYAHSDKGAKFAVEQIRKGGGKADAFQADLQSIEATRGLARQIQGRLEPVRALNSSRICCFRGRPECR